MIVANELASQYKAEHNWRNAHTHTKSHSVLVGL